MRSTAELPPGRRTPSIGGRPLRAPERVACWRPLPSRTSSPGTACRRRPATPSGAPARAPRWTSSSSAATRLWRSSSRALRACDGATSAGCAPCAGTSGRGSSSESSPIWAARHARWTTGSSPCRWPLCSASAPSPHPTLMVASRRDRRAQHPVLRRQPRHPAPLRRRRVGRPRVPRPAVQQQRHLQRALRRAPRRAGASQIKAFEDTWTWDLSAQWSYKNTVEAGGQVSKALQAFHTLLGPSNMLAYLAMMAPRLVELRRALKPTGSIYLHCDPTASHYLKLLLDAVFGPQFFRNEVVWQRTAAKGDARRKLGSVHDVLLTYGKTAEAKFRPVRRKPDEEYGARFCYNDNDGRGPYRLAPLDSPNPRPNLTYEYKGYAPPAKGWRVNLELMKRLH